MKTIEYISSTQATTSTDEDGNTINHLPVHKFVVKESNDVVVERQVTAWREKPIKVVRNGEIVDDVELVLEAQTEQVIETKEVARPIEKIGAPTREEAEVILQARINNN